MARARNPQRVLENCLWLPTILGWPNGPSAEAQERCIDKAFGGRTTLQNPTPGRQLSQRTVATTSTEKEAMVNVAVFFFSVALLLALAYGVSKIIPD